MVTGDTSKKPANHIPRSTKGRDTKSYGSAEDGTAWAHKNGFDVVNGAIVNHLKGKLGPDGIEKIQIFINSKGRIKTHKGTRYANVSEPGKKSRADTVRDKEIIDALNDAAKGNTTVLKSDTANRAKEQIEMYLNWGGDIPDGFLSKARELYNKLLDENGHVIVRKNANIMTRDGYWYTLKATATTTNAGSNDRKKTGLNNDGSIDGRTKVGKAMLAKEAASVDRKVTGLKNDGTPDKRTNAGKALLAAKPAPPPAPKVVKTSNSSSKSRTTSSYSSSSYSSSSYSSSYSSPSYSSSYSSPSYSSGHGSTSSSTGRARSNYVNGYTRANGTVVSGYYRS